MFLEISQNSQENTCVRVSFNKVAGLRPATLLKKRSWHRSFAVNFVKFLRTPFFIEHLWYPTRWVHLCWWHRFDQRLCKEEGKTVAASYPCVCWIQSTEQWYQNRTYGPEKRWKEKWGMVQHENARFINGWSRRHGT